MATIKVHNISDRPNTPGPTVSVVIGGQKIRPGRHVVLDDSVLNSRHRAMHGTRLWFGDLPARFTRTSKSALDAVHQVAEETASILTLEEVRAHLQTLSTDAILAMASAANPPVDFPPGVQRAALVARLSRALFQEDRELDPEVFFWLGRWTRTSGGFVPK